MAIPSIEELNGKYAGKWILVERLGESVRLHKVQAVKDRFICTFLVETERTWRMAGKDGSVEFSSEPHSAETISFEDLESGVARTIATEEALEVIRGFRETLAKVL